MNLKNGPQTPSPRTKIDLMSNVITCEVDECGQIFDRGVKTTLYPDPQNVETSVHDKGEKVIRIIVFNRYCNNSHVSERAMREIYLRGFGLCVRKSQPHAVMTSYNLLNGTHTAEHRGLIEDVLRCEFGFEGIVMTDWVMSVMDSKKSIYRNSLSNEVAGAGGDLFMPGGKKDYENVLAALKDGRLDRKQLEINATRVVRMSRKLA